MTDTTQLALCLAAWPLAGLAVLWSMRRQGAASVGLPFAYFMGWGLIHWPGAALYLIPDHVFYDPEAIATGFAISTIGLAGYMLGFFLAQPKARALKRFFSTEEVRETPQLAQLNRASIWFLVLGLLTQLLLLPLLGTIPSLAALLSGVASLSITGACLGLHQAILRRDRLQVAGWWLVAALFPFITLTSAAFLGFGTYSLMVVVAFGAMYIRRRRMALLLVLAIPATYLALSLFVTYMRDRAELREVLWFEQPSSMERLSRVAKLFSEFEFLQLDREEHRVAIDLRLNQNHLVAAAHSMMEPGYREFTYGQSIFTAFAALVPRVIWPDKPAFGGSGDIVAEYTGLTFSEGTSVGVGQVLEFYINFGTWGVFIGYIVLGAVIRWFDFRAARGLRAADYRVFVLWFVPGLALLQSGGNLAEVFASVAAAIGAGLGAAALLEQYLHQRARRRARAQAMLRQLEAQRRRSPHERHPAGTRRP